MEDDKLESRALLALLASNSFAETSSDAKERGVFAPCENISFCSVKQNPVITEKGACSSFPGQNSCVNRPADLSVGTLFPVHIWLSTAAGEVSWPLENCWLSNYT